MNRLLRTQEVELQRRDEQLAALQAESALVREQGEMRRFLADYGLQWVGGSKPSSRAVERGAAAEADAAPAPPTRRRQRARKRPAAGGGACRTWRRCAARSTSSTASRASGGIVRRRDGSHGFEEQALSLTFWRDGLQVDRAAARVRRRVSDRLPPRPPRRLLRTS